MTHTYAAGSAVIETLDKRLALPISGDATRRHRSETVEPTYTLVNVWRNPRVVPSRQTYGIAVGMLIRTYYGSIEVTAVGTVAGWGMLNGQEVRWEARDVLSVPAA